MYSVFFFCCFGFPKQDDTDDNLFDLSDENNFQQSSQNSLSQQSGFSDSRLNGTLLTQDKLVAAPHKVISA